MFEQSLLQKLESFLELIYAIEKIDILRNLFLRLIELVAFLRN